jgi:4-hydroxy-tetrahydrodipicolinate reductase
MIRVAVSGAAGRMGETVCAAIDDADDTELAARADPELDSPLGDALEAADVLVDFTTPDVAPGNAAAAVAAGVHAVVGTSGFDLDELRRRVEAERTDGANCFVAPNFSIGAVLMIQLAERASRHLPRAEIIEFHHERKLDAPSGTAKHTLERLKEAGAEVSEPVHSVRLPGLLAHQEVIFGGEGQTLTIRHDSIDRTSFMPGVLLAVRRVGDLPDAFTVGLDALLDD